MTKLLPWTTNLYAPINIYLSSDNLMFSDTIHSPISISESFITTVTIQIQDIKKNINKIKITDGIVEDNEELQVKKDKDFA